MNLVISACQIGIRRVSNICCLLIKRYDPQAIYFHYWKRKISRQQNHDRWIVDVTGESISFNNNTFIYPNSCNWQENIPPRHFPSNKGTRKCLLKPYTTLTDVMDHASVGAWDRKTNEIRFPPKLSHQRALLVIVTQQQSFASGNARHSLGASSMDHPVL